MQNHTFIPKIFLWRFQMKFIPMLDLRASTMLQYDMIITKHDHHKIYWACNIDANLIFFPPWNKLSRLHQVISFGIVFAIVNQKRHDVQTPKLSRKSVILVMFAVTIISGNLDFSFASLSFCSFSHHETTFSDISLMNKLLGNYTNLSILLIFLPHIV